MELCVHETLLERTTNQQFFQIMKTSPTPPINFPGPLWNNCHSDTNMCKVHTANDTPYDAHNRTHGCEQQRQCVKHRYYATCAER